MPRAVTVSKKELMNLTTIGGRGCRYSSDDSTPWKFNIPCPNTNTSFVTPAAYNPAASSLVEFEELCPSESDGEYDAYSTASSNMSNESISVSSEDSSCYTVGQEELDEKVTKVNGNRLIHYPALTGAIKDIASCKACYADQVDSEFELFLEFCDLKWEEVMNDGRLLCVAEEGKFLRDNVNVRNWYNEWKQNRVFKAVNLHCSEVTNGLATELTLSCDRCTVLGANDKRGWKNHFVSVKHNQREKKDMATHSALCAYDINLRFCYALQLMGVGGGHATTLASFLELPEAHKWSRQVSVLEKFTFPVIEKVKKDCEQKGTEEEIRATINDTEYPIEQNLLEANLHRVRASYDMGWQVRSSGNKYGSPTGHGLLLGAVTKKVMDSVIFNKKCATCTKQGLHTKQHHCVKNYEGSSKSMEAAGLVMMLNRMPIEKNVSISTIISDDDSNARAKAQHPNNGGQLTITTEEPTFLADPSHRKRVFARAIYNLACAPVKVSKVSKGLAGHLKYCYGAAVKRYRHLTSGELSEKIYNVLEHICGNHEKCEESWCYDVKAMKANKEYKAPADHRIDITDTTTYSQLKKYLISTPMSTKWRTATTPMTPRPTKP
jgi:hypothetical protein